MYIVLEILYVFFAPVLTRNIYLVSFVAHHTHHPCDVALACNSQSSQCLAGSSHKGI